jgi:hypothetical protein
MSAAPWVIDHWINYWFSVRHEGVKGHAPHQCREHVRYWISLARESERISNV